MLGNSCTNYWNTVDKVSPWSVGACQKARHAFTWTRLFFVQRDLDVGVLVTLLFGYACHVFSVATEESL